MSSIISTLKGWEPQKHSSWKFKGSLGFWPILLRGVLGVVRKPTWVPFFMFYCLFVNFRTFPPPPLPPHFPLIPHERKLNFSLYHFSSRMLKQVSNGQFHHLGETSAQKMSLTFFLIFLFVQWKPLNVITLGQRETDNINRMIIISK